MAFQPTELSIATMTMTGNLNVKINVKVLAKFIKLSDDFKEIRYRGVIYNSKGITKNKKKSFYNQITIVIKGINTYVNMKLFSNGKIQMTGCKSSDEVKEAIKKITNEIYSIDGVYKVKIKKENGYLIDNQNVIYSRKDIIGYKDDDMGYLINGEYMNNSGNNIYTNNDDIIRTKKKYIYNSEGDEIGCQILEFYNNRKYRKSEYKIIDDKIIKNNNEIGQITTNINRDKIITYDDDINEVVLRLRVVKDEVRLTDLKIENINSCYNCFKKNGETYSIDREILSDIITKEGIISNFNPNIYPGINMKYIYNGVDTSGICKCDNECRWVNGKMMGENKCKRISLFIFQSGSIIITGGNNIEQLKQAYDCINSLIRKNEDIVILEDDVNGFSKFLMNL